MYARLSTADDARDEPRMTEAASPVALAVAPNGGRRTKADHPAIPLTAAELARCAAECLEAGAAMIHVHVRDADGRHLLDAGAYAEATRAIRGAVGDRLVVQITSESLERYTPAEQRAVVKATRAEAVSLALRELAPDESEEAGFSELIAWALRDGCTPQVILYAPEEATRLDDLARRGLIPVDLPVLYVLGRYTLGQLSAPADLLPFIAESMPRFRHWSVCAFGAREAACVATAAALGGHARVGFENNLALPDRSHAASNADLVRATADLIIRLGLTLSDADALRDAWRS